MQQHQIVSREQWVAARKAHLAHEKELSQARERLAEERRALPWVKVDKSYVFDGPNGKVTLGDLFKGRPQLVVQHVMFAPDWEAACKSCSFWAMASSAWCRIWRRATRLWSRSRWRRSKSSRRSRGAWAGALTGCLQAERLHENGVALQLRQLLVEPVEPGVEDHRVLPVVGLVVDRGERAGAAFRAFA